MDHILPLQRKNNENLKITKELQVHQERKYCYGDFATFLVPKTYSGHPWFHKKAAQILLVTEKDRNPMPKKRFDVESNPILVYPKKPKDQTLPEKSFLENSVMTVKKDDENQSKSSLKR